MSGEGVFALALAASLATIAVAIAYAARAIAASYVVLRGAADDNFDQSARHLAAGEFLPSPIAEKLGGSDDYLIAFLSSGCGSCAAAAAALADMPESTPIVVFAIGDGAAGAALAERAALYGGKTAATAAETLGLSAYPVLVHARDGRVVGSMYGNAASIAENVRLWWDYGRVSAPAA